MASGVQHINFTRKNEGPKPQQSVRHTGILQDQLRRSARRPWAPSMSFAIRILLLARFMSAMYSSIDDCDEVFNFWEPLHFFDRGYGFQTWETTPQYAIRSWGYILLHLLPIRIAGLLGPDKRPAFFGVRLFLAFISSFVEAKFYRAVHEHVNERVGRYLFFMLLTSAGMWNASTAFLPSSFAMYTTALASAYSIDYCSTANRSRTRYATTIFVLGAIVGWPFALALGIPFVFEELFLPGKDVVPSARHNEWIARRWTRLFASGAIASLILIPIVAIDSVAYGRLVVTPWNIVRYNIFSGSERGPDLYGSESFTYYFRNLLLNFNVLVPLALASIPAATVTSFVDRRRLGFPGSTPAQSSAFTMLVFRLAPFYLWMFILTMQNHKEERFMFPVYPLLCFNAAVTLYLIRGWMETVFIKATNSPYRASRSAIFRTFTSSVVLGSAVISISRILALLYYYHAPMSTYYQLEANELPRLLNNTGLLAEAPADATEDDMPRVDLSPIREFNLTLCVGNEWYRFPSHYLVPDGLRVDWVKSGFDGLLPGHFGEGAYAEAQPTSETFASVYWPRPQTRLEPVDQNDLNKGEPSHYAPVGGCDYVIDVALPSSPPDDLEPWHATYEKVSCLPFLDARLSSTLTRTLWMPGERWQTGNTWGQYCLFRDNKKLDAKIAIVKAHQ
ncbi:glycosyltransferase family 22 protein [Fistulina hepatica ATCC 64428]|nr:glycosyltransferase family 22 protein [Fistulina hepatica ATCC 64428]